MVLVAAASELKFRKRSADLALAGSVDAQIILELAVWGLVGWLVVTANLRNGRLKTPRARLLGPAVRLLVLICALGIGSAVVTGGALPLVRAGQFTTMTVIGIVAYHRGHTDRGVVELWVTLRRAMMVFAVTASAATLVVWPGRGDAGIDRFHWFEVHPIATAGMLGVALVMAMSMLFGIPDPWLRSGRRWAVYGVVVGLLVTLLVMTGSRGAMGGTLLGMATVGVLSPHRRRRGLALLVSTVAAALLALGLGNAAIVSVATRGQTAAQLLTLTGRTELFGIAYDLFLERPWLGYGFLSGREVFLERVSWAGEAHNMFVEVAISLGLVGLLLYLAVFFWLARVAIGALMQRRTAVGAVVRDTAGLLMFVIVAGGVTSGAAGVPGIQWLAVVATAIVADHWHEKRRIARLRQRRAVHGPPRRQRDSMTSA